MSDKLIELLLQYEGIFGVLIGFVLSEVFKRLGKIKVYTNKIERMYILNQDSYGCQKEVLRNDGDFNVENVYQSKVGISMDITNSFQENKTLRNVHIEVILRNGEKVKITPQDVSTRKYSAHINHYDNVTILNLPSKEIRTYDLFVYLPKEYAIESISKIYFVGKNANGIAFRRRLMCYINQ